MLIVWIDDYGLVERPVFNKIEHENLEEALNNT
jgi:hypothetical protein